MAKGTSSGAETATHAFRDVLAKNGDNAHGGAVVSRGLVTSLARSVGGLSRKPWTAGAPTVAAEHRLRPRQVHGF
jgi:hypothetical protein